MEQGNDIIETLWRRYQYLDLIQNDETQTTRKEIADRLGLSVSTVYKHLKQLEEHNLVREVRNDGGRSYVLTTFGDIALERYVDLMKVCCFSSPLVDPEIESELPSEVVSVCDFYPSVEHAPQKPVKEVRRFLRENDEIRSFASIVLPTYVEMYYENIMDGTEVELVCQERVIEHLRDDYSDYLHGALGSGNLDLWVTDGDIPFGLVVSSEGVRLVMYEGGSLVGVMASDDRKGINWGMKVFEKYRSQGKSIKEDVDEPVL